MTEQRTNDQSSAPQGSATDQLKQVLQERLNQGVGLAAKAAGQQAGTLAQAVRQAGEEMREQGQDDQGKIADQVAQPVQKLSASLTQAEPQELTGSVKQVRPKLNQGVQQLKTQVDNQVNKQAATRAAQAGQGVTTLTQGVRETGQQLRAQGQEVPALVLDALVERLEPLGTYLTTADANKLRSDVTVFGRQTRTRLSSAADTVTRRQEAATTKSAQAVKQTASAVRRNPWLPIVGALVGTGLVARRSRAGQPQAPASTPEKATKSELQDLTRTELQERAAAMGLPIDSDMTKKQLIDAIRKA